MWEIRPNFEWVWRKISFWQGATGLSTPIKAKFSSKSDAGRFEERNSRQLLHNSI
jgi:hypothetical protein